jgi:hypothetical protein
VLVVVNNVTAESVALSILSGLVLYYTGAVIIIVIVTNTAARQNLLSAKVS